MWSHMDNWGKLDVEYSHKRKNTARAKTYFGWDIFFQSELLPVRRGWCDKPVTRIIKWVTNESNYCGWDKRLVTPTVEKKSPSVEFGMSPPFWNEHESSWNPHCTTPPPSWKMISNHLDINSLSFLCLQHFSCHHQDDNQQCNCIFEWVVLNVKEIGSTLMVMMPWRMKG